MPRFNERRNQVFKKVRPLLVEPVATLLAAAYEPRADNEATPREYEELVKQKQAELRSGIKGLTARDGGKVEALALAKVYELLAQAKIHQLEGSASILETALHRRDKVHVDKREEPRKISEVERIPGASGKPIGLWR